MRQHESMRNLYIKFCLSVIISPRHVPFCMLCTQCCVDTFPSGGGGLGLFFLGTQQNFAVASPRTLR